jgi:hypothetical protein
MVFFEIERDAFLLGLTGLGLASFGALAAPLAAPAAILSLLSLPAVLGPVLLAVAVPLPMALLGAL